jgi:hypothetical protein
VYDDLPAEITTAVEHVTRHDCHLGPGYDMFRLELHLPRLLRELQAQRQPDIHDAAAAAAAAATAVTTTLEVVSSAEEADFLYVPVYPNQYMCALAARHNRTFDRADYAHAMEIGTGCGWMGVGVDAWGWDGGQIRPELL